MSARCTVHAASGMHMHVCAKHPMSLLLLLQCGSHTRLLVVQLPAKHG